MALDIDVSVESGEERDCFAELKPVIREIEQGIKDKEETESGTLLYIRETEDGLALTVKKVWPWLPRTRSS